MSKAAKEVIQNHLSDNGGIAPEREVIQAQVEARDVTEATANDYITMYCERMEDEDTGETLVYLTGRRPDDDTDVESADEPVGRRTADRFEERTVFQDVAHPQVPQGHEEGYYRRRVQGRKSDVQVVTRALEKGNNVLLKGDTGVGKDKLIKHIAAKTNQPLYQVNFSKDTRVEDLIGYQDLVADNGSTEMEWVDGILTKAVRNGGVFLADEINGASGAATMALHSVTEKEDPKLTIPQTGEVVTPHEEFRVVGTLNERYAGTKKMNRAFMNRFVNIPLDYLNVGDLSPTQVNDAEVQIVMGGAGLGDSYEQDIRRLVSFAAKLRQSYKNGDIITPISIRELIQVGEYIEGGFMELEPAVRLVIVGLADQDDKSVIDTVIGKKL